MASSLQDQHNLLWRLSRELRLIAIEQDPRQLLVTQTITDYAVAAFTGSVLSPSTSELPPPALQGGAATSRALAPAATAASRIYKAFRRSAAAVMTYTPETGPG